jgi:ligand-binding sensor domain-containing protein/signal transduction histidine kinase
MRKDLSPPSLHPPFPARLWLAALVACVLALGAGLPAAARAQQPLLRFERLSAAHGLSHDRVYAILQDRSGFLWFGTGEGLNRYNGYRFDVYAFDPDDPFSLSDSVVYALHEDRAGALWVGTRSGLNRLDAAGGGFVRFQHPPDNPRGASANIVADIAEDARGALWVSSPGGVDRFDPATQTFAAASFEPPLDAQGPASAAGMTLYLDRAGTLWAGGGGGLYRLDPDAATFRQVEVAPGDAHPAVRALFEDREGNLWIGTAQGLYVRGADGKATRYRHDPARPRSLSDDSVLAIAEDRTGTLWVGTASGGLNALDRATGSFTSHRHDPLNPNSLAGDTASVLYLDRGGLLWISASRAGVSMHNPATRRFQHYTHSPTDPQTIGARNIAAVYEDSQGIVWSGGYNQDGLSALDRARGEVTIYRHDPGDPNSISHDSVYEIYEDRAGALWVGTLEGGLNRFDRTTGSFTSYRHDPGDPQSLSNEIIPALLEDSRGRFWVGTEDGLNLLDRKSGKFRVFRSDPGDARTLGHSEISHLYEDAQGTLWAGTWGGGLNRFDPIGETFTRYMHEPDDLQSISDNRIFSFAGDRAGNLWIGTYVGLNKFSPASGRFVRYGEKHGLPSSAVRCVLLDASDRVWVGTSSGLARFDPASETFTRFDETDGLQSYGFNGGACGQGQRGELLFGGLNGFNIFDPLAIRPGDSPPPLALLGISVLNEPLELADPAQLTGLSLAHDDTIVAFEFAALDYADPAGNQYAYKLEGFDEEWVPAGERRVATYTNLDGGEYVFRVKAAGSDGVWNEQGLTLPVHVATAPWQTWWAYSLYALAAVALVGGGARHVTQAQTNRRLQAEIAERERAQRELEQLYQVAQELREQVEEAAVREERVRLARDLHDSVTQSIYSLALLAESWRLAAQEDQLAQVEQQFGRLGTIAHDALREMRLLIYQLRLPELADDGLIAALQRRLDVVERRAGIEAQLQVEGALPLSAAVAEQIYRIVQEALNNALKHAAATAVAVIIRARPSTGELGLEVEVRDNGQGFSPPDTLPGVGLESMRERAANLGATLSVISAPGEGCSVVLRGRFPIVERSAG